MYKAVDQRPFSLTVIVQIRCDADRFLSDYVTNFVHKTFI